MKQHVDFLIRITLSVAAIGFAAQKAHSLAATQISSGEADQARSHLRYGYEAKQRADKSYSGTLGAVGQAGGSFGASSGSQQVNNSMSQGYAHSTQAITDANDCISHAVEAMNIAGQYTDQKAQSIYSEASSLNQQCQGIGKNAKHTAEHIPQASQPLNNFAGQPQPQPQPQSQQQPQSQPPPSSSPTPETAGSEIPESLGDENYEEKLEELQKDDELAQELEEKEEELATIIEEDQEPEEEEGQQVGDNNQQVQENVPVNTLNLVEDAYVNDSQRDPAPTTVSDL